MKKNICYILFVILYFILSCRNPETFNNPFDKDNSEYIDVSTITEIEPTDDSIIKTIYPRLRWNDNIIFEGYKIYISQNLDFNNSFIYESTSDSVTVTTDLIPGKIYYWKFQFKYKNKYIDKWSNIFKFRINDIVLLTPINQTQVDTLKPYFEWAGVNGVNNWSFQISKNSDFTAIIYEKVTDKNNINISDYTLDMGTTYYWRTGNNDSSSDYSAINSFTTKKIELFEPFQNASISNLSPVFKWSDLSGDDGYYIELSETFAFDNVYPGAGVTVYENKYQLVDAPLLKNKDYFWRVRLKDGVNNNWSDVYKLSTVDFLLNLVSPIAEITQIRPKFMWESTIKNAFYNIQLSKSVDFLINEVSDDALTVSYYDLIYDLTNFEKYFWRVKVKDGGVWSNWSQTQTFNINIDLGDITLSTPVNDITSDNTIVNFNWNENSNAVKYEFNIINENGQIIALYNGAELSYTPPALNVGVYYWNVKFYNSQNIYGGISETRKITIDIGIVDLITPENNSKLPTDFKPIFSWIDNPKVDKYELEVSKYSDFITNDISIATYISQLTTSFALTNDNYFWRVRSIKNGIKGKWSEVRNIRFYDIPLNVTVSKGAEDNRIQISWNNVTYAEKYYIYRSDNSNDNFIKIGETSKDTTIYYDNSALSKTLYYYKLKAYFDDGSLSEFSDYDTGFIECGPPNNIIVSDNIICRIDLSWDAVDGVDKYFIYRSTENDGSYREIGYTTNNFFSDNNPRINVNYYYKIKSYTDNLGLSDFSSNNIGISKEMKQFKEISNHNWDGRSSHTSVVFDNKMWIIGGNDINSDPKNDVWYSIDGINWTQATSSAPWSARSGHTSVVFDNKIWIIGGCEHGYQNDVWYSGDGINWTEAKSSAPWSARYEHTSVVFDNKMWVIGGYGGGYKNDVWNSGDGINWTQATSNAPWSARSRHTSVVFDNKIWVLGGYDLYYDNKNDVWYSSDGINWTQATSNAPWSARHSHTSVVFDNKIWVLGGYDLYYDNKNDIWYSNDGINWNQAIIDPGWSERNSHVSVVFNNKIWIIGGYNGNSLNDVWSSQN